MWSLLLPVTGTSDYLDIHHSAAEFTFTADLLPVSLGLKSSEAALLTGMFP